jgi:hypothetical protein
MSIFKSPEEKEAEKFAKSPVGMARAARKAGSRIFQIALEMNITRAGVVLYKVEALFNIPTETEHALVLGAIEAEGWQLEHADYVFRATGSESRDKHLFGGEKANVFGTMLGIYIFRRDEQFIEPLEEVDKKNKM